jgi:hypothetical protein
MRAFVILCVCLGACGGDDKGRKQGSTESTETPGLPAEVCVQGEVSSELGSKVALHTLLEVTLDEAAPAWVICSLDDDPEEVHLFEATEAATEHRFDLLGMLPDVPYACVVSTCRTEAVATIEVEAEPLWSKPTFSITEGDPDAQDGFYTLLNNTTGCFSGAMSNVVVVDPHGRVRWVYEIGYDYVVDMDASLTPFGDIHVGGGWGVFDSFQDNRGTQRTIGLDGTVLMRRDAPDFGEGFNHHSEVLETGEVLSLTGSSNADDSRSWWGVGVELFDPSTEELRWSWQTQPLVDEGVLSAVPGEDTPWHANSVTFRDDVDGPAAMISLYIAEQLWRVDRDTGELSWVFGRDGDFELLDTDGAPLEDSEWFFGQHDPDYRDDRVLLYDNGNGRPGGSYSRAAEYALDTDAMTATLLWAWTEDNWYNPVVGDADWWGDDVVITKGFMGCWSPGSSDRSAVVQVDPATDAVLWRMDFDDASQVVYRSERYDGCSLFHNAKYCPDVAERVAELSL